MNKEEKWIQSERKRVVQYLKNNVDQYNAVGEVPAFYFYPYFAIWAIESKNCVGSVGFWVFSGDIPTDIVLRDWNDNDDNPRKALKRILKIWRKYIPYLSKGKNPPDIKMGNNIKERKEISELLLRRIKILNEILKDNDVWDYNV